MAMRSRTTFKKRQKELARQEKQRDKAARRLQRKLEKHSPETGDVAVDDLEEGADEGMETVAPSGDAQSPSNVP